MMPIRLMWFVPSPVAVVADGLGLNAGITIEATRNPSSDAQFEALASGRVEAVVTAMDNVMDWNLREGPGDLRIAAQLESTTPLALVGQVGIRSLADCRGADILVDAPRNGFVVALQALLAQSGVEPGSYRMTSSGGVKERFDDLLAGKGDATLLGPPFDGQAVQSGLRIVCRVQDRYPTFPGQGLVVRRSTLQSLRVELAAWLRNLDKAREVMAADVASARAALLAAGFPAPAVEAMLAAAPRSLRPDRAGVELLIQQRRSVGLRGAEVSYEGLVDTCALPAH
jgi:ABC-type nitrate/sulfonate/bicarbonate transport system substrate-binding protein